MTLREAQALILLFQHCRDETVRRRALELVPDLQDFSEGWPRLPVDVVITKDGKPVSLFGADR